MNFWEQGFAGAHPDFGETAVTREQNQAYARQAAGKRILHVFCHACADLSDDYLGTPMPRRTKFDLEQIYECPQGHMGLTLLIDGPPGKTLVVFQREGGSR